PGRQEGPDLRPCVRAPELVAVGEEAVALGVATDPAHARGELRGRVDGERLGPARPLDVEVEGRARRPLAVLGDDLVPGAVTPVVRGIGDAVLLRGVGDESDRALGAEAGLAEGAGELERDCDARRIVEGGAEPAVV